VKENYEHVLDFALRLAYFGLPWIQYAFQTPLYGSFCLPEMIVKSLPRTPSHFFRDSQQSLILFLCRIDREIASGQIHDSKLGDVRNQHLCPAAWNVVHWIPRCASTIMYCCITIMQLLHRWQHQSRKFWIPCLIQTMVTVVQYFSIVIEKKKIVKENYHSVINTEYESF
jgi:hypothetical protein